MVLGGYDSRPGGLARRIAEQYVEAVLEVFEEIGTLSETSPRRPTAGNPAQADFCGSAGLGSVAIPHSLGTSMT